MATAAEQKITTPYADSITKGEYLDSKRDDRTQAEHDETAAIVIATDRWMSNCGECEGGGRSIVGRPIPSIRINTPDGNATGTDHYYDVDRDELDRVKRLFKNRDGFLRVRIVYAKEYKPRLAENDRLHIYSFDSFNNS